MQEVCYLGSLLLSLLTGSLAVTLLSLYQGAEAVLIIIVCSCYVHIILQLLLLFLQWDHYYYLIKVLFGLLQLVTVGSAIEFFHYWNNYSVFSSNPLHKRIILAFESSLLFLLSVNGIFLGIWKKAKDKTIEVDTNENLSNRIETLGNFKENNNLLYVPNDKFVPLKDSAQTLTPQMFNIQLGVNNNNILFDESNQNGLEMVLNNNKGSDFDSTNKHGNWIKNERSHSKTSESESNASVIRHQLGRSHSHSFKNNNFNKKLRSLSMSSFNSKKSSPSRSPLKNIQALKIKASRKFQLNPMKIKKEKQIQVRRSQDKRPIGLNAKYITRLSTISDLHKSFINILSTSNSEDGVNSRHTSVSNNDIMDQMKGKGHNNNIINTTSNEHYNSSSSAYQQSSFIEVPGHVLNGEQFQNISPKLTEERQAIGRLNNALLPPCLRKHENNFTDSNKLSTLPSQSSGAPSFLIPEMSNDDKCTINDPQDNVLNELNDLTQIPDIGYGTDQNFITPSKARKAFEYPPNISLDMWETNKVDFMRKASENSQHSMLMSPFQFNLNITKMQSISESPLLESKQKFTFPNKNKVLNDIPDENSKIEANDKQSNPNLDKIKQNITHNKSISDTISELDKYLNDYEGSSRDQSQLLEESLRQDTESVTHILTSTSERVSHEFARSSFRHSPTKSLVSIISGGTNSCVNNISLHKQRSQNLSFSTPTHAKTPSQLLQYSFPPNINNMSTQSSPSKHRFKKIGKKLSLSNISDTMFSETEFENGHSRNQSVEFTYIHNLQNSRHFPSKSVSEIPTKSLSSYKHCNNVSRFRTDAAQFNTEISKKKYDRRHSMIAVEKVLRSASSMFYKHNNVAIELTPISDAMKEPVHQPPPIEQQSEERKISNQTSLGSENVYPDIVMSEYDREKWNTMKNLNIIDDEGHLIE